MCSLLSLSLSLSLSLLILSLPSSLFSLLLHHHYHMLSFSLSTHTHLNDDDNDTLSLFSLYPQVHIQFVCAFFIGAQKIILAAVTLGESYMVKKLFYLKDSDLQLLTWFL
jgi:hypothetical protein